MYIAVVSLEVDDIDRAIEFYTGKLGWQKTMDEPMGPDARWVTVAPEGGQAAFTLVKRSAPSDKPYSGIVIEVDDVTRAYEQLRGAGVEFKEPPRIEPWGAWASFEDSEGNVHGLHSAVAAGVGSNVS